MSATLRPDDYEAKRNDSAEIVAATDSPVESGLGTSRQATKKKRWSTRRRLLTIALPLLALLIIAAGFYWLLRPSVRPLTMPPLPAKLSTEQLGLANWQAYQQALPAHPLDNPALPTTPQVTKESATLELEDAAGQALIQQGKLEQGIGYLKAAALSAPDNLRIANDLRLALRNHQRYTEEEAFFASLVKRLNTPNVLISLALSYVDEMRSCPKPPDGLVCQAQYSSRSISVLNSVLDKQPYNIIAHYARGLNDLYWPTLMGHLPQAQEDLQYAVALAHLQHPIGPAFTQQAYVALGDVFAKGSKLDEARNVWLNGLNASSQQTVLQSRLAIPQDHLVSQEDQALRGLGVYVDTDITIFWQKAR